MLALQSFPLASVAELMLQSLAIAHCGAASFWTAHRQCKSRPIPCRVTRR
jgi:hypothetical protein